MSKLDKLKVHFSQAKMSVKHSFSDQMKPTDSNAPTLGQNAPPHPAGATGAPLDLGATPKNPLPTSTEAGPPATLPTTTESGAAALPTGTEAHEKPPMGPPQPSQGSYPPTHQQDLPKPSGWDLGLCKRCPECRSEFENEDILNQHMQKYHALQNIFRSNTPDNADERLSSVSQQSLAYEDYPKYPFNKEPSPEDIQNESTFYSRTRPICTLVRTFNQAAKCFKYSLKTNGSYEHRNGLYVQLRKLYEKLIQERVHAETLLSEKQKDLPEYNDFCASYQNVFLECRERFYRAYPNISKDSVIANDHSILQSTSAGNPNGQGPKFEESAITPPGVNNTQNFQRNGNLDFQGPRDPNQVQSEPSAGRHPQAPPVSSEARSDPNARQNQQNFPPQNVGTIPTQTFAQPQGILKSQNSAPREGTGQRVQMGNQIQFQLPAPKHTSSPQTVQTYVPSSNNDQGMQNNGFNPYQPQPNHFNVPQQNVQQPHIPQPTGYVNQPQAQGQPQTFGQTFAFGQTHSPQTFSQTYGPPAGHQGPPQTYEQSFSPQMPSNGNSSQPSPQNLSAAGGHIPQNQGFMPPPQNLYYGPPVQNTGIAAPPTDIATLLLLQQDRNNFNIKERMIQFDGTILTYIHWRGQWQNNWYTMRTILGMDDQRIYQKFLETITPNYVNRFRALTPGHETLKKILSDLHNEFGTEDKRRNALTRELKKVTSKKLTFNKKDADSTRETLLNLNVYYEHFKNAGLIETDGTSFIIEVQQMLPKSVLREWNKYKITAQRLDKPINAEAFLKCVTDQFDLERDINDAYNEPETPQKPQKDRKNNEGSVPRNFATRQSDDPCIFCNQPSHGEKSSLKCEKLKEMTSKQVNQAIQKANACTLCCRPGHSGKDCSTGLKPCKVKKKDGTVCGKPHCHAAHNDNDRETPKGQKSKPERAKGNVKQTKEDTEESPTADEETSGETEETPQE